EGGGRGGAGDGPYHMPAHAARRQSEDATLGQRQGDGEEGAGGAGEEHDLGEGVAADQSLGDGIHHGHAENAGGHVEDAAQRDVVPASAAGDGGAHGAAARRFRTASASRWAI